MTNEEYLEKYQKEYGSLDEEEKNTFLNLENNL